VLTRAAHASHISFTAAISPALYGRQKTTVLINAFENQTGDRTLD
jgi:hypothetical protein